MEGLEFRFDREFSSLLERLAAKGPIDLASPYLGADQLARFPISRVLTDAKAWIRSESNREAASQWLIAGTATFRDLPHLHAKVAIGVDAALVSSANFTSRGLGKDGNVEAGFLITDPEILSTIRTQYERWWLHAKDIDGVEFAQRWREALVAPAIPAPIAFAIPYVPQTMASPADEILPLDSDKERLLDRLACFPSRAEGEAFVSLAADLLAYLNVSPNDPRIIATAPSTNTSLSLNVNGRWVFRVSFENGLPVYGAMVPLGTAERYGTHSEFRFALKTGSEFVRFTSMETLHDDSNLLEAWQEMCRQQLASQSGGPLARYRSLAYTRLLADKGWRAATFDRLENELGFDLAFKVPVSGLIYWTYEEWQKCLRSPTHRFYSRQKRLFSELPIGSRLWLATYVREGRDTARLILTAALEIVDHGSEEGEAYVVGDPSHSAYFVSEDADATASIAESLGRSPSTSALNLVQRFRTSRLLSPDADAALLDASASLLSLGWRRSA